MAKLAFQLFASDPSDEGPFTCEISAGHEKPVRIGRDPNSDVPLTTQGVSWHHTEFRLHMDDGEPKIIIKDVSTNGTGLKMPDGERFERLSKNVEREVVDGSAVMLPMKVHSGKEDLRKTFTVRVLRDQQALPAESHATPPPSEVTASPAEGMDAYPEVVAVDGDAADSALSFLRSTRGPAQAVEIPPEEASGDGSDQDEDLVVQRKRPRLSMPPVPPSGEDVRPPAPAVPTGLLDVPRLPTLSISPTVTWPSKIVGHVHESKNLIVEAHNLVTTGMPVEAWDKFKRGLGNLINVLRTLRRDDTQADKLRIYIDRCFDCVDALKERRLIDK